MFHDLDYKDWPQKMKNLRQNRTDEIETLGNVIAILENIQTGKKQIHVGNNIVTNAGDLYYAQSACGESPTKDFDAGGLRLGSNSADPTKNSSDVGTFLTGTAHSIDATYEKTNDGDSDNTGAGTDIVTWRYSYLVSEGNVNNIIEGAIVDNTTTPTAALCHFEFPASFNKTASDTLKIFVNHTMNGV